MRKTLRRVGRLIAVLVVPLFPKADPRVCFFYGIKKRVAKYLLRDRDAVYGSQFQRRVKSPGIEEVLTAPRSPWQNAYVERVIGSIRRDCLDHVVVLNERHL